MLMTKEELEAQFESDDSLAPCALIRFQGELGIALKIGENLTKHWQSGDVIVFWENGEHTVLADQFTLIRFNLWSLEEE
jgi:hypothetical protein